MNKEDINVVLKALGYYKLKNPKDKEKINKVMLNVSNLMHEQKKDQNFNIDDLNLSDREKKYYTYFETIEDAEKFREKLSEILLNAYPNGVTIPEICTFVPYPYKTKNDEAKYKAHIVFKPSLLSKLYDKLPSPEKELDKNR